MGTVQFINKAVKPDGIDIKDGWARLKFETH